MSFINIPNYEEEIGLVKMQLVSNVPDSVSWSIIRGPQVAASELYGVIT
jgi:hypothetical protein